MLACPKVSRVGDRAVKLLSDHCLVSKWPPRNIPAGDAATGEELRPAEDATMVRDRGRGATSSFLMTRASAASEAKSSALVMEVNGFHDPWTGMTFVVF